jgi:predicted dehydrogenase
MTRPLRYVLIGAGGWGRHWCTEVLPRLNALGLAEAAAAVDIDPEALPPAQADLGLGGDQLYTDAGEAIAATKPDFIVIVVPPAHHEAMVDLAIRHRCHVLSEKPIADTMAACVRIHDKVNKAGLKMAVTMSHRFDQDKQSLERLVKSGAYGKLDYVVGRNTWDCRKYPSWGAFRYRIPDPLLIEGTVHHFDIMRALAGSNAQTVYARTWNPRWSEFQGDAQGLIIVDMENGVKVFYEGAKANASTLNGWGQDYWRAECDKATLELDRRKLRVIAGGIGHDAAIQEKPLEQQPVWTNPWLAELFVDWLGGGAAPENTLEDNIQCAALLFAAIESAHTGKPVDVQAFLQQSLAAVVA